MYIRPDYHEEGIYHIYNRGVAKQRIFRKESDYLDFREIMRYYLIGFPKREGPASTAKRGESDPSQKYPKRRMMEDTPMSWKADPAGNGMFRRLINLLAFCLMPNHFHFVIRILETGRDNSEPMTCSPAKCIPEFMKRLAITYAMNFNRDYRRVGPIYQGRYKIKELDTDERVTHVTRYTHVNPVKAGLVKSPQLWPWSDIQDYYNFHSPTLSALSKPLFVMEFFNRKPNSYRDFVEAQFTDSDAEVISAVAIDLDE